MNLTMAVAGMAASSQIVLAPADLATDDQFGRSVAASGNLLVVGAPSLGFPAQGVGAVYVYQRSGASWTLQARITPQNGWGLPGDAFGTSVAIDGNTIVVGSPGDGTAGLVYIFVNNNGVWTQQPDVLRASDNFFFGDFGASVSISKDTVAVGAPWTRQGAVYVYTHSSVTGFWDPQAKLVPGDATGGYLGTSTSLIGNTVVAGAPSAPGTTRGAAYVFDRQNGVWNRSAVLTPNSIATIFGFSIAMSGSTLVVGAPDGFGAGSGTGSAFVFTQNNGVWTQQARFQGNGLAGNGANLGWSVAVNGNTFAAGAITDSLVSATGTAYVYSGNGTNWQLVAKQGPDGGVYGQAFGFSTAVIDGNTIAAGSPFVGTLNTPRTGAVYVTQR